MPGTPAWFQARVDKHLFDKIRLPTLTVAHLPTVVHWYQHRVWRDNLIADHYTFIDKLLPGASSSTHAAHDARKRWWPQGISAWRASRSSTRQTSQRSGGSTAADGATFPLAVGTSSTSSLWLTACRNWIRVYPPLSKQFRQALIHRSSDL